MLYLCASDNTQMLKWVDQVLDVPQDQRPIILLLADEGPWPNGYRYDEFGFDLGQLPPSDRDAVAPRERPQVGGHAADALVRDRAEHDQVGAQRGVAAQAHLEAAPRRHQGDLPGLLRRLHQR